MQLPQSYHGLPLLDWSHLTAVLCLNIYIFLSCWASFQKGFQHKKKGRKKKAGSRRQQVCKVWLVLFIASSLHLTSLFYVFILLFLRLCSSLFITILKLTTGWVSGEVRSGGDPVCSSGFGSIRMGSMGRLGFVDVCVAPSQISVSRSVFCLELSSSGRLPLWTLRTETSI